MHYSRCFFFFLHNDQQLVLINKGFTWPVIMVCFICMSTQANKKVLLRKRKRHTARRVASARYAALSNGGGGVPHPVLDRGITHPVLVRGVPHLVLAGGEGLGWDGVTPPSQEG